MAARQAQTRPDDTERYSPPFVALLAALQAQQNEQVALYKSWLEEAREATQLVQKEAQELRALLAEREETTRETLSHMDMLHDQNIMQLKDAAERERGQWEREVAAKEAEIERLKAELALKKSGPQLWRK